MEPSNNKIDAASITELINKDMYAFSDENYIIESVKFMREKLDGFSKNMQGVIIKVKYIIEENQVLKERKYKTDK